MEWKLSVQKDSEVIDITYDTELNKFTNWTDINSDDIPSGKYSQLKINLVMGTNCNYKCKYCCQNEMKHTHLKLEDIDKFSTNLHKYIDTYFKEYKSIYILLWGGEPLLYFDMVKMLVERLSDLTDEVKFGLCTNGELLDEPKLTYILDNNIGVGFSYDGPGQSVRHHTDVLAKGSFQLEALKMGLKKQWSLNPTWHKANPSPKKYAEYMTDRLETEDWSLHGDIQALIVIDEISRRYALSLDELKNFLIELLDDIYGQEHKHYMQFYHPVALNFIKSLNNKQCFGGCQNTAPTPHALNIDIEGGVWRCHSFVGRYTDELGGNLYIGSITSPRKDTDLKVLNNRRRTKCINCPLVTICGGGCPLPPMKYEDLNCNIQYHKWFPALSLALNILTDGGQLVDLTPYK